MQRTVGKHLPQMLGTVFLYSAGYKILFPGGATYSLMAVGMSHWVATCVIVLVTGLELYLGAILVLRLDPKTGIVASSVLISAFTVFLWYLSTMSHPPACGCMGLTGMFKTTKQEALFGLLRNCILLWSLKFSYDYYFGVRKADAVPSSSPTAAPAPQLQNP